MTPQEALERESAIAAAESYVGTPFHHQGRLKGIGVDCAYLLAEVYEQACHMPRMDFGYYPIDWFRHSKDERYRDGVERRCHQVETPEPGDIALFRMGHCYSHGAIVVEWPRVIHAHWRNGVEFANALQAPLAGREPVFYSPWCDSPEVNS